MGVDSSYTAALVALKPLHWYLAAYEVLMNELGRIDLGNLSYTSHLLFFPPALTSLDAMNIFLCGISSTLLEVFRGKGEERQITGVH